MREGEEILEMILVASPGFVSVGLRAGIVHFALGRVGAGGTGNGGTTRRWGVEGRGTLGLLHFCH